jgi:phage baseplate assembly protein W
MTDLFKTDLRLVFANQESEMTVDLARSGNSHIVFSTMTMPHIDLAHAGNTLETVTGIDNLAQALTMRLLVDEGELTQLAHPHYGSRLSKLLGEALDKANLELMRRYVKQTLLSDPRVAEVVQVKVEIRPATTLGIVDVEAVVKAIDGKTAQIGVSLNAL